VRPLSSYTLTADFKSPFLVWYLMARFNDRRDVYSTASWKLQRLKPNTFKQSMKQLKKDIKKKINTINLVVLCLLLTKTQTNRQINK
jgi:hypothetical protein